MPFAAEPLMAFTLAPGPCNNVTTQLSLAHHPDSAFWGSARFTLKCMVCQSLCRLSFYSCHFHNISLASPELPSAALNFSHGIRRKRFSGTMSHLRVGVAHLDVLCCLPVLRLAICAGMAIGVRVAVREAALVCRSTTGLAEAGPCQAVMALKLWLERPPRAPPPGKPVTMPIPIQLSLFQIVVASIHRSAFNISSKERCALRAVVYCKLTLLCRAGSMAQATAIINCGQSSHVQLSALSCRGRCGVPGGAAAGAELG